jgi:acetolactate synthase-1/2/3 large subunit
LAVGCRFNEVFTTGWSMPMPENLIQIDLDATRFGVNYPVAIGMAGDAKATLQAILNDFPNQTREWKTAWERIRSAEQLKPEWLIETVRKEIPEDAIVFGDASEMALRMHVDFPAYAPRTFFYPSNYAALGWGYPAALGGAVAAGGKWVVCVCGDGGCLMSANEMAIAAQYKLRVITIVHNDSAFGAIKSIQRANHEGNYLDVDLVNPDFVKFGESFGVPSCRCGNAGELAAAIKAALGRDGPSLIEVPDEWRSLRF